MSRISKPLSCLKILRLSTRLAVYGRTSAPASAPKSGLAPPLLINCVEANWSISIYRHFCPPDALPAIKAIQARFFCSTGLEVCTCLLPLPRSHVLFPLPPPPPPPPSPPPHTTLGGALPCTAARTVRVAPHARRSTPVHGDKDGARSATRSDEHFHARRQGRCA